MSITDKKHILIDYFRKNGGLPRGAILIDNDTENIGNVSVNGTWFGTFDYIDKKFIQKAE